MVFAVYRSSIVVASVLLAVEAVTPVAHAEDPGPSDSLSVTVKSADLDLTTEKGVSMLNRRIAQAAVQACGEPAGRTISDWTLVWDCRANAIAQAKPRVDTILAAAQHSVGYVASLPTNGLPSNIK